MTGKEYLSRFQYQMDIVDRLAERLDGVKTISTSQISENKNSVNHYGDIQRTPESATILWEKYSYQLNILWNMQMDLIRLTTNISDNLIATYLLKRYCSRQDCKRIAKEMHHTVEWMENKSAEILNDLL